MNEVVKYQNVMNTLRFKDFDKQDLNVFMTICAAAKDKDDEILEFSYEHLREITGSKADTYKRFHQELGKMNKKLLAMTSSIQLSEMVAVDFVLFSTFGRDLENKKLRVRVNPDFRFLLNAVAKEFTYFDLQQFVSLESKHTKNLYRLLKQYKKTGTYSVSIETFREVMDIPSGYTNRDIMQKIIKPAIKELIDNCYFEGLEVYPKTASTPGAPVKSYEFRFKKEQKQYPGQMTLPGTRKNAFLDYEQREYDYEALEKALVVNFSGE